jgi:hypothetical protein
LTLSLDPVQPLSAETRRRVELARLEADVAYFCARLELVGQPVSSNQVAQRKAYWHLYKQLSSRVAAAQETQPKVFSLDGLFDG